MNKALVVWGDSSSKLGESEFPNDASMLVVQYEANVFDGLFAFMEKSDNEEKLTLFDLKKNVNTYSFRRLRNLESVLIDYVIELTTKKDSMNNRWRGTWSVLRKNFKLL